MTTRTYTHPDVLTAGVAEGWAEAETDPARIDWPARQARAAIPFQVIDGRPVNPCEKTAVRYGRNEMGFWGEQLMADAIVTFRVPGAGRYLLMVERGDGYGWAVPGGHVEPGETGLHAAIRELREETALSVGPERCRQMPPRYVPDPRASDEAWAVTVPVAVDLGERDIAVTGYPLAEGGDDARRAEWIPADCYGLVVLALSDLYGGKVFAAHVAMLRDFLGEEAPPRRLADEAQDRARRPWRRFRRHHRDPGPRKCLYCQATADALEDGAVILTAADVATVRQALTDAMSWRGALLGGDWYPDRTGDERLTGEYSTVLARLAGPAVVRWGVGGHSV